MYSNVIICAEMAGQSDERDQKTVVYRCKGAWLARLHLQCSRARSIDHFRQRGGKGLAMRDYCTSSFTLTLMTS